MASESDLDHVGRAVAARRGQLGMTQQDLADAAGVDLKTIYNLESGTRWPIARTRAAVSAALSWEGDALAAIRAGADPAGAAPGAEGSPVAAPILDQADQDRLQDYLEDVLQEIQDAVALKGAGAAGRDIFKDPGEIRIWDTSPWSQANRVRAIAAMRMLMDDVLPGRRGRHGREASGQLNARCNKTVTIGNVRDMSLAVRTLTS